RRVLLNSDLLISFAQRAKAGYRSVEPFQIRLQDLRQLESANASMRARMVDVHCVTQAVRPFRNHCRRKCHQRYVLKMLVMTFMCSFRDSGHGSAKSGREQIFNYRKRRQFELNRAEGYLFSRTQGQIIGPTALDVAK